MTADSDYDVPDDVRVLLRVHIDSYEQLETLLLLRAHRNQSWSADSVGHRLNIPVTSAATTLDELRGKNFLDARTEEGFLLFAYRPSDFDESIDHLALTYEERRLAIIKIMNANALHRVRTAAITTFADAFILGSKKKDG